MKAHPTNPYGVLVPCANCGRELHVPRSEAEAEGFGPITCSDACMKAFRAKEEAMPEMRGSDVLDWTIGKFTNEALEAASKVTWKDEDEVEDVPVGPIFVETREEDPTTGLRTGPVTGSETGPSWYTQREARALADELGVPYEEV